MSSYGDVIRRTNVSATTKRTRRAKDANKGDSSRRKGRRRNRRLEEERNRRAALVVFSSFLLFATVLFLFLRPKEAHLGIDSERFARAKVLRNAVLSGDKGGKPTSTMRYLDPRQLPPLPGEPSERYNGKGRKGGFSGAGDDEWQADEKAFFNQNRGPQVDYTKHEYEYPELIFEPQNDGTYPPLEPMSSIFETWGQDDLDSPPDTLIEVLQHFDYQDPEQLEVRILSVNIIIIMSYSTRAKY